MTDKFKHSDYISIVKALIPDIEDVENPLDLSKVTASSFPDLKNIVLIGDKQ